MLLDAATVWTLVKALGATASVTAVFSSFMISCLFRTVGVLPGGLGTYETSSVLTLQLVGVPTPVALSATLLYRGLSFWLPMIPGLWLSRRLFGGVNRVEQQPLACSWTLTPREVITRLDSSDRGLSAQQAAQRLRTVWRNELTSGRPLSKSDVFLHQFATPCFSYCCLQP